MVTTRAGLAIACASVLAACELTDVVVAPGQPVIVVQGVVRTDLDVQSVFVERSLTGAQFDDDETIPITDATVTIARINRGAGPCGDPVILRHVPNVPGRYSSDAGCLDVDPGDSLLLLVRTSDGGFVTGTMRAPGIELADVRVNGDPIDAGAPLAPIERRRDTITVALDTLFGRALNVEVLGYRGLAGIGEEVQFYSDSMFMRIPTDFRDFTEGDIGDQGAPVFRAGRIVQVTVGLTDQNYFDFVRSGNDPFTGRGFINHLEGGIGVFGGLDARYYVFPVIDDIDDPREGEYRLVGIVGGLPAEVTYTLYIDDIDEDVVTFSGFLAGTWQGQTLSVSADGYFLGDQMVLDLDLSVGDRLEFYQMQGPTTPGVRLTVRNQTGTIVGELRQE